MGGHSRCLLLMFSTSKVTDSFECDDVHRFGVIIDSRTSFKITIINVLNPESCIYSSLL
jgi:hypothetical protein